MTENTVTTDKLVEDLRVLVRDAEALVEATAAQTGEKIHGVRQQARESLDKARARLAAAEQQALREGRKVASNADEFVHSNPWQAAGIAAGIGLVVGLLISRR
ncbi:MAG: DUF883 family protein [Gammaproteobacteria bacterium]|nr:DUF883 family protein [Gammaproteobacteria bacterium]